MAAGHFRLGDYSMDRRVPGELVFTRHPHPGRYGFGLFWILPAGFLVWKVFRRVREHPRDWWRKLGWKLNLGVPLFVFACALVAGGGSRVIIHGHEKRIIEETTWAGLRVRRLKEVPLQGARALRVLTLDADRFALAIEWHANAHPTQLFVVEGKHANAAVARKLLAVMERYVADETGLRRFQK